MCLATKDVKNTGTNTKRLSLKVQLNTKYSQNILILSITNQLSINMFQKTSSLKTFNLKNAILRDTIENEEGFLTIDSLSHATDPKFYSSSSSLIIFDVVTTNLVKL